MLFEGLEKDCTIIHGASAENIILAFRELSTSMMDKKSKSSYVASEYLRACEFFPVREDKSFVACCTATDECEADGGVTSISAASSLDFTRSCLGVRNLLSIFAVLPMCRFLCSIDLSQSRLDCTLVMLLCEVCTPLSQLQVLNLSHNPFGSVGVAALIALAKRNTALLSVILDSVETIPVLFRRLSAVLEQNKIRRR